uniref:Uncharacterized protein LOC104232941 n=1 Tax=Nicotiana sylvestris TaxID=4096 RepID=A0A1U7XDJ0_NICSY
MESEKGKAIKLSGNHVSYAQADSIFLKPWGGFGGSKWNYMLKSPIKEILIAHGDCIDSIMFITVTEQGTTIDSPKFGGGGGRRAKVVFEATPLEYLTGINGTFGYGGSHLVIKSLCFITNAKSYGPFGSKDGGTPFSLVMKEGVAIVGFHGCSGLYLDAIGVYLQKLTPPTSAKEPMVEDIEIHDVSFSTLRKDSLNVLDFIESLKNEEIQKVDDADLIEKLILELDFLLLNLHHLSKYRVDQLSSFMTEYEFLQNVCGNIRHFHELIVNGCVGHENVEYVLPQFQLMAKRVGRFLWQNQIGGHSRLFKLTHLFLEIIPTQLEVMHICLTNLKASTSTKVGRFIKQLLETSPDILREYLIHLQEHMINVITASSPGAHNIHIMIEFLLIILTDMPKDFIHNGKLFKFLARVGALTRDVSSMARNLEEKSKNEESTNETNSATLGLLEKIELLKKELKDVYLKAPDSSQLCFPMSDGPLFMHLLLRHLDDLLNSNTYLVALIKEEIRLVKEDLEFIRSFFGNVEQELYKDLWARVLDVAYETKDVIDSIIVRDNGLLHLIFSLPFTIEKINLIKEGVSNLFEKIPKNMGVIVVNSPNKPVDRKSSIAGKIIVGFKEETAGVIAGKEMKRSVWLEVRNDLNSFIFQKEEDVMRVIALSYDHLPDPLKSCLIHLASFPKDEAIPVRNLEILWLAEGFLEQREMKSVEKLFDIYLDNLISSSLVISFNEIGDDRTCQIHDLVHDFCLIKAREEKLFGKISSIAPSSSSSDLMPRQMNIEYRKWHFGHNNFVLFDSKKKRHSGKHLCSLRITGHIYDDNSLNDICHLRHLRLLRVLQVDRFSITVNDSLLNEICTLVHLRYLNIQTEVDSLPLSFSNLWNLETLRVNNFGPPLVLLPTILNLVKLQVLGINDCSFFDLDTDEPILVGEDSKLESLRLLRGLKLSNSKDIDDIFKRFPNLQELQFDLKKSWDCSTDRYWFPKLDFLNELESLKVTFEDSYSNDSAFSAATNRLWDFHFPSSVKMLCLCEFPLTSDSLSTIGILPKLEDLYLED